MFFYFFDSLINIFKIYVFEFEIDGRIDYLLVKYDE